jgi:hypothetical protein
MKNDFPVLIEIDDPEGIMVFEGVLKKRPSIHCDPTEIPYISTSTWVQSKYEWNHIELGFIEECEKKQNWISNWVNKTSSSITGREGYARDHKKTINLISLDNNDLYKWTVMGAMIISFNMIFHPEQNLKNVIKNSKIFRRKVLFEKKGNAIKEIGFHMTLSIDKALLF